MVDIQTISIAIASTGVFAAAIYYIFQIRHQTRIRQTDLVTRLYSQYSSLEFQKLWEEIQKREITNFDDYTKKYGWADTLSVTLFFEGIAILLQRKLIDIELVFDMFGISIKMTWEKVKPTALEARKFFNKPDLFSWLEYLYDEMKKREQKLERGV